MSTSSQKYHRHASSRLWDPRFLPGLKLWLAGDRSPVTLNAGAVSQWNDVSGSANHVTQGTATLQPVLTRADNLENSLTFSEQFDDTDWSKTEVTVSADVGADPNGGTTADKIIPSTNNTTHTIKQTSVPVEASTEYTFSVVAKANGYDFVILIVHDGTSNVGWAGFDLSDGTIASTTAGTATITDLGSGLYRCEIKYTTGASAAVTTNTAYIAPTNSIAAYVGDGTSGVNLWGAQANPGAFVSYAATESVPSYPGVNGIPGARSDETDDVLESSVAFNNDHIFASTKKTILLAYKAGPNVVSNKRLAVGVSSGGSSFWGIFNAVNNAINWKYRTAVPANGTLTGPTMSANGVYILGFRHDGANVSGYANSLTASDTASDGQTSGETSTSAMEFSKAGGGTLAEAIVCSGVATTDAQFNRAMTYLANKYGVTLT